MSTITVEVEDLVTLTDMKTELGHASRSVIANWISRYPDFPKPVIVTTTNSVRLWSRRQINEWIEAN